MSEHMNGGTKSFCCGKLRAKQHMPEYERYLLALDLSTNTRIAYKYQILHFLRWLEASAIADYTLGEPEARDAVVSQYKSFLKRHKGAKGRTINCALTAIDSFCQFLGFGKAAVEREREDVLRNQR